MGTLRGRWANPMIRSLTVLVLTGQLAWLHRGLQLDQIRPRPEDQVAGDALIQSLAEICPEGRILAPHFAWIPTRLGRDPSAHLIAIWDLNHVGGPYMREVRRMMGEASSAHHWSCVLQGAHRHEVAYGTRARLRDRRAPAPRGHPPEAEDRLAGVRQRGPAPRAAPVTPPDATALRRLPKVDRIAGAIDPPSVAAEAARQVIDEVRVAILAGDVPDPWPDFVALARRRARLLRSGRLVPVINATGVVIHTNLGRAPWSRSARQAAERAAAYCDLELDLASGDRGGRLSGLTAQLRALTGAAGALVVNNCAAAVLLAVTAVARDRQVVVSRGELVEIGGSFRVPDVIASGGARLCEVGTTNRTRVSDYAAAVGPDTAAFLRVHPSNFRVVGFTEAPDRRQLVALGQQHGIVVIEDLGSGSLDGARGETAVRDAVAAGVDLVAFSGGQAVGGPPGRESSWARPKPWRACGPTPCTAPCGSTR